MELKEIKDSNLKETLQKLQNDYKWKVNAEPMPIYARTKQGDIISPYYEVSLKRHVRDTNMVLHFNCRVSSFDEFNKDVKSYVKAQKTMMGNDSLSYQLSLSSEPVINNFKTISDGEVSILAELQNLSATCLKQAENVKQTEHDEPEI